MKLSELISKVEIKKIIGEPGIDIGSVCYDSRKAEPGCLFVAIRGYTTDGHKYIDMAINKGAVAVVCEDTGAVQQRVTYAVCEDSRLALAEIAHTLYGNPAQGLKIIGVTGTNGKTTVTYLIRDILKEAGHSTGIIGTTGIFTGEKKLPATHTTPESLELAEILSEMKKAGVEYVIMEVSSHALIQHRVHGIEFIAGIFTNLTHEHLDFHKDMNEYASAKKQLFSRLGRDSFAVINADDEYAGFMAESIICKVSRFGKKASTGFLIVDEKLGFESLSFKIKFKNEELDIYSPLVGRFNVENAAAAASVALNIRIKKETIRNALARSTGAPGRMQRIKISSGAIGIVDYAHTPDALEKALKAANDVLAESGSDGKLICVFGCGGDRDSSKRAPMGRIATENADFVIITDDNPRTEEPYAIFQDILMGVVKDNYDIVPGRSQAIALAKLIAESGDIVLVAGKGHEDYQIIGTERRHFCDVEELNSE